ncbi:ABC transporter permease subunit [Halobacillus locisalis]|uniref:ABC transporter permease subunit n=1 Tax=Halobacillus locisalis TaxID=220753 RepID=A0A838CXV7_9BACI|nr:ABC transporter permease subunit [Halobacillus locisalis]MBA2176763.1 ABC transporter permease subunit [Halobacillus locisalis]
MKWYKTKAFYLFIPSFLFLLIPMYGLVQAFIQSLSTDGALTFEFYQRLFESDRFLASLGFSLQTAFTSSLLSLVIGVLLTRSCYQLLESYAPRLIVWLPMLFPHFVWGYMVILLLSESGVLSQLLQVTGVLSDSGGLPTLTRDASGLGIIITYVWKEVPFVILMLLPVYASIKPEYYDLVKNLGGNSFRQFTSVEWPHILPVMIETFLIIFSFTLSAYEVPALLGTTFPEMVSVLSYDWFYGSSWDDRPLAFAAMISISLIILVLTLLSYLLLSKRQWKAMRGRLK